MATDDSDEDLLSRRHPPKRRRTFVENYESSLAETEVFVEKGLRKIQPYFFEHACAAKGRWYNRAIGEVFKKEFRDQLPEYYEQAIRSGLIRVNGLVVDSAYVVKNEDRISHLMHRHEPPVTSQPLKVVYQSEDVLVVDKPGSIPVHPSGRYRNNSVVAMLRRDLGFMQVFPVNRLDRLTSGLLIFALTKARSQALEKEMRERKIFKEYICRVRGHFPEKEVLCDKPILTVSHKLGLCAVSDKGKECQTIFNLIEYHATSNTSVVKCRPLTGRMHQIRVHLQWLGYPIANDPLYGGQLNNGTPCLIGSDNSGFADESMSKIGLETPFELLDKLPQESEDEFRRKLARHNCAECRISRTDPHPSRLLIWLHSVKYASEDGSWNYETDMPSWADNTSFIWEQDSTNEVPTPPEVAL